MYKWKMCRMLCRRLISRMSAYVVDFWWPIISMDATGSVFFIVELCGPVWVPHRVVTTSLENDTTSNVHCKGQGHFTVGAAGDWAVPTVGWQCPSKPAALTDASVKTAGKGGWYYQPPLQMGWLVRAAGDRAALTVDGCISGYTHLLLPRATHSISQKKGWEALGSSQKIALLRGEVLISIPLVGRL